MIVSLTTNLVIYRLNPDYYVPALAAKLAICPINVLSPAAKTMPLPVPYLFKVEKMQYFLFIKDYHLYTKVFLQVAMSLQSMKSYQLSYR